MSLKFTVISGTTNVTQNMYLYEYGNEMIIVDCGVGFPGLDMQGVDLVIPDFTYVKQNKNKLKGILVSQGHEDHQGALAYLFADVQAPIYAPKLTAAFIKDNLDDNGIKGAQINIYNPDQDVLTIGSFKVTPFRVSHSVPDTLGFSIDTPEGQVFHVAEHKFDPNPVDGNTFDREKAKKLASKGVMLLASDCLGANKPGRTPSEQGIEEKIDKIARGAKGAIFFSAISSNIGRIQQAVNVAGKNNRSVVFVGFSITRKSELAQQIGYLKYGKTKVLGIRESSKVPDNQLMYIIAGSFGQVGSSLFRVATASHEKVAASKGDMLILASDPGPPYSRENMDFIVDSFIDLGVDAHYYDLHEGLHVSGHGAQEDIVELFNIAKPKYYTPLGGTVRYMHSYRKLAQENGAAPESIFEMRPGESLEFANGKAKRAGKMEVKEVLVDGLGIGDVGKVVLSDRKTLGEHGIAIALVQINTAKKQVVADPEIISRGFVFEKGEKGFLKDSGKVLRQRIGKMKKLDRRSVHFITTKFLADLFFKETGRRPMILPVVVEV